MAKLRTFFVLLLFIRIMVIAGSLVRVGGPVSAAPVDSLQVAASQQQIETLQRAIEAAQTAQQRLVAGQGRIRAAEPAIEGDAGGVTSGGMDTPTSDLQATLNQLELDNQRLLGQIGLAAGPVDTLAARLYAQQVDQLTGAIEMARTEQGRLMRQSSATGPADSPSVGTDAALRIDELEQALQEIQAENMRLAGSFDASAMSDTLQAESLDPMAVLKQAVGAAQAENERLRARLSGFSPVTSVSDQGVDPYAARLEQLQQTLDEIRTVNIRLQSGLNP